MGLGIRGGGLGAAKFMAERGARVTITDTRSKKELAPSLDALRRFKNIRVVLGKHEKSDFTRADLIVKNPGVRPNSPYLLLAKSRRIPVTSDMGIFFMCAPATLIGVTGTRGKSTTAHLIWKFLKTKNVRVFLGGNIGRKESLLDSLENLKKGDIVVVELSSFQLWDIRENTFGGDGAGTGRKSPHIAVITNILHDHLNWHGTMKEYEDAKRVIFQFQSPKDYLFANPRDPRVRNMARSAPSRVVYPRLPAAYKKLVDANIGAHYESSIALAIAVARHFKIPAASVKKVLMEFRGLPGREEEICAINGIHFINDTTSTMPDAASAAIRRFRKKASHGKLILIAGGMDKNLDFSEMAREVRKSVDTLVLLPGTGTEKLKNELGIMNYELRIRKEESENFYEATSMKEAVRTAYRRATKGDYILLSPGATSFGLFLNEFDRGDRFVKEVKRLKP